MGEQTPLQKMEAQMEPLAVAVCDDEHVALVSIAISLKRIADAWGMAPPSDDETPF